MLTHRMSGSKNPLYVKWRSMKGRCYNKNNQKYHRYGGRGIVVCKEWKHDFVAFYTWSLANGYANGLTIDRIDNDGNYSPENCRYATAYTQSRNNSKNLYVTVKGERLTINDVAKKYGLNRATLQDRYHRGWRGDKIILPTNTYHKPGWSNKPKITLGSAIIIKKSLAEGVGICSLATKYNVDPNVILRIKRGQSWQNA